MPPTPCFCLLEGVQIPVLIGTGLIKSIISSRVFERISETSAHGKQPPPSIRNTSSICLSITGQPLNSSLSIAASLSFSGSVFTYQEDFLVCDNVLNCSWLRLSHCKIFTACCFGGSFSLVGPHGATPITPLTKPVKTSAQNFSFFSSPANQGQVPVFMQSSDLLTEIELRKRH